MAQSIDTVVEVIIDRQTKIPTRTGFGTPVVIDQNSIQTNDVDTISDLDELVDLGFDSADEAYKAFETMFSQNPRPPQAKLFKRAANVAQVNNVDVVGADDGTYRVTINGTNFDFVASSSTTALIAAGLISAINAGSEPVTAAPGAGDSLDLTADVAGTGFSITVSTITAPSANLVLTETTANKGIADEFTRLRSLDDDFYFVISTSRTEQDILALAGAVEAAIKLYGFDTDDADSKDLSPQTDTTSIFAQLKALSLDRTFGLWSDDLDNYPVAGWIGKIAPKDPGSVTWKFKTIAGAAVSALTTTEVNNITGLKGNVHKNGNVYTTVGGINITQEGIVFSGEFIDIIRGTDWMQARISENVFTVLANEDKVPFTNPGIEQVLTAIRQIGVQAEQRNIIRTGTFEVTAPDILDIPVADRAQRFLDGVEFTGIYAGAIHKVRIQGRLSV